MDFIFSGSTELAKNIAWITTIGAIFYVTLIFIVAFSSPSKPPETKVYLDDQIVTIQRIKPSGSSIHSIVLLLIFGGYLLSLIIWLSSLLLLLALIPVLYFTLLWIYQKREIFKKKIKEFLDWFLVR